MAADVRVERAEGRAGVAMIVRRKIARIGVDGEGAERAGEARELDEDVLRMRVAGGAEVLQGRDGAVQRVQEPVVGDVERSGAGLKAALAASAASDGGAFFADGVEQTPDEQHERLAGAEAQAGRDEFLVEDQVSTAIAQHAGDGDGEHLGC